MKKKELFIGKPGDRFLINGDTTILEVQEDRLICVKGGDSWREGEFYRAVDYNLSDMPYNHFFKEDFKYLGNFSKSEQAVDFWNRIK